MKDFRNINPYVTVIFFLSVTILPMFSKNPVISVISLAGALLCGAVFDKRSAKFHLLMFSLLFILSLINPLMSHSGATVLFVLNDNPIMLEAFIYGVNSACSVVSVIYWFGCFTKIMSGDKLLYVLSPLSPKIAMTISMALRFIPFYSKEAEKIKNTQMANGLYKDGNIIDRIKGGFRVFSLMLTKSLEDGIITADSMSARGYGVGRRTHLRIFRFGFYDLFITLFILILLSLQVTFLAVGKLEFSFYPVISAPNLSLMTFLFYVFYLLLAFLPLIIETKETIKWKYLKSKI